jgi:hypothetical protein
MLRSTPSHSCHVEERAEERSTVHIEWWNPTFRKPRNVGHPVIVILGAGARGLRSAGILPAIWRAFPPAYRAAETAALLLLKGGDFFVDRTGPLTGMRKTIPRLPSS